MSADPLSPERGSYQFAQQMLRQVAYDTLSRRDRKSRHLKVAAHLRAAFPGDGEEVTDVIARHYLDALQAAPDDSDSAEIREQAITTLIRAAERAQRTGAPGLAAVSYASAAELTSSDIHGKHPGSGLLWERAAEAAVNNASWATAIEHAQPRPTLITCNRARPGRPLGPRPRPGRRCAYGAASPKRVSSSPPPWRSCAPTPDTDTVRALEELAIVEVFAGSPDADRLTTEALALGQALDVGTDQLAGLFLTRAMYLSSAGRRPQAGAYLRESVRLATQVGDNFRLGRALLNMSDILTVTDPVAGAEAARTAAERLRLSRRPGLSGVCGHESGPGADDAGRLGRRRKRARPGRGLLRAGRPWPPRLPPGMAGGAARRHRCRDRAGRIAETCRPAKIPRTWP